MKFFGLLDSGDEEDSALIRKRAEPAPVPPQLERTQQEASLGWFRRAIGWILGHTASDICRLKEAGITRFEGEASQRVNEAKKTEAEAHMIYVEIEEKRQNMAIRSATAGIEVMERLGEIDPDRLERIAAAIERITAAISRIKMNGGDVLFDLQQLEENLLRLEEQQAKLLGESGGEARREGMS